MQLDLIILSILLRNPKSISFKIKVFMLFKILRLKVMLLYELENEIEKIKWDQFNNVSKTIKTTNYLIIKTNCASVDFNCWYYDQFYFKRYMISLFHLFVLIFDLLIGFYFLHYDTLIYKKLNFLPKNPKSLTSVGVIVVVFAFIIMLDVFIGEWNRRILIYKYFHYLQEDIQSKYGLTRKNYKKLSILVRMAELIVLRGAIPLISIFCILFSLFVAITSGNITFLTFLGPLIIYGVIICASSMSLSGTIGFVSMYYFKLLFDQINDQMESINKKEFITFMDRMRLIWLTKKHNLITISVNKTNLTIRKTVCAVFMMLSFMQIIPLNLYLESDFWLEKFPMYFFYQQQSVLVSEYLLFSVQINAAHKLYKTIYKILKRKQKFQVYFLWKVISLN